MAFLFPSKSEAQADYYSGRAISPVATPVLITMSGGRSADAVRQRRALIAPGTA
jgi:hypothetical protein